MQYGPVSDESNANYGPLSSWRSMLERYRALLPHASHNLSSIGGPG